MLVVPLDGSRAAERALPVARAIAGRVGAGMILAMTHWNGWEPARCADYLARMESEQDVPTETALIDEPPAQLIEHVANDGPGRVVCMTTHGRGSFRWAMLGSVAEQVVRENLKPLLLVGRHCRADWAGDAGLMAVCVDGSERTEPVVPVAAAWARTLGLDVRVVVVRHPLDVEAAMHPSGIGPAIADGFAASGVHATSIELSATFVAGAIADFARELPATLIAMNTHGRAGVARVALGSVAMATVGLAECPVLLAPIPAGTTAT